MNLSHFHPLIVIFPIALITIGFIFDFIAMLSEKETGLSKIGYWLKIIGMATAILAFGTGFFFTSPRVGEAGLVRDKHELFATFTLISIIIATLFNIVMKYQHKEKTWLKYVSLILFFMAFILVCITGYLGGSLVIDSITTGQ